MTEHSVEQAFYGWLNAESKAEHDLHFTRFYQGFSRVLEGSIRKRFRGMGQHVIDDAIAEAMLIMLEKFGEPRRAAFVAVPEMLARLQPLELGPLHTRRVVRWKTHISQYRLDVLGYTPAAASSNADRQQQIDALVAQHRGLHNDGYACMNDLRAKIETTHPTPEQLKRAVNLFIKALHQRLASESAQTIDQTWQLEGASRFVLSMDELLTALPKLRVLSPAYVFVVCMNELKALFSAGQEGGDRPTSRLDEDSNERDSKVPEEGEDHDVHERVEPDFGHDEEPANWHSDGIHGEVESLADPSEGPEERMAQQQLFHLLLAALQAPIREAQDALARTHTKKDRDRAQTAVNRALREHELDCSLLIGWIEGESQEAQAEQLGLTRNQVRTGQERLGKHILEYCESRGLPYGDDVRALANGQSRRTSLSLRTLAGHAAN
jgi:hypothetical protein